MEKQIQENRNKDIFCSFVLFILLYALLFYLNAIFPTQSDDLGNKIGGLKAAINSYKGWNGRFGELLLKSFGSYFATTAFWPFVNAIVGTSVVMLIFLNMFGRFPKNSPQDISCFFVLVAFLMFDPVSSFGSIFYWAAGSFNYLWGWFFILLALTPIVFFWRGKTFSKPQNHFLLILGIPLGIIAGWMSEMGIVVILFLIANVIVAKVQNRKLPAWYYFILCAFILGWCILYACPGMRERAKLIDSYHSLKSLLMLDPTDLTKEIIDTFEFTHNLYYENFFFLSLFLILSALLCNPSVKKIRTNVIIVLALFYILRSMLKIYFLLGELFVCLNFAVIDKKENKFLSDLFAFLTGIFIAEFLFIGATIQVSIPLRARLQFSILNFGIIAATMILCFEHFKENKKVQKIAASICVLLSVMFICLVSIACFKMHNRWNLMEKSIAAQKAQGITNIVVNKNTFISTYKNYGDWGNPGENPDVWPNTQYAQYYGVDSFVAK